MMATTRYYLSGPMRGIPQYNFPQFHRVAALLRAHGYDIVSPAELDSEAVRKVATNSALGTECDRDGQIGGETPGEILARDVRIVHDLCTGLIFLPGWERSRGARLEAFVALLLPAYTFLLWDDEAAVLVPLSRRSVECAIHAAWGTR